MCSPAVASSRVFLVSKGVWLASVQPVVHRARPALSGLPAGDHDASPQLQHGHQAAWLVGRLALMLLLHPSQKAGVHAGAGNEADARSCRSFKPESPTILVVGNEGRGLRPVVRRACRDVLRIDSVVVEGNQFSPVGVESLNVSMAAGILLHQLLHPE